jgi:flagellar assembly factor FliW
MKINTKAFGLVDIDERQVIRFPTGLYGFEKFKEYALMESAQKPYFWLQSVEVKELAFILIDPFLYKADYEPDIPDAELAEIGVKGADDLLLFSIVTVPADGGPITGNLMGPIVICKESRLGLQTVLNDPRWKVKHDIMAELASGRS